MNLLFKCLIFVIMAVAGLMSVKTVSWRLFEVWAWPDYTHSFELYQFIGYFALFLVCVFGVLHIFKKITLSRLDIWLVCIMALLGLVEALAILPCFIPPSKGDGLCGVLSVIIHQFTSVVYVITLFRLIYVVLMSPVRPSAESQSITDAK